MKASVIFSKVLSIVFTFGSASASSQVSAKWPPCPLLILLSRVTDLASLVVYVGVDSKVCFHGFYPSDSILSFSKKVSGKGRFNFSGAS